MEDRRQRKTRTAVQNAFMRLMLEKDISKITVKDVAELADINRSTFYLHYCDVYDVQDDIEREAVEDIARFVREMDLAAMLRDPYPLLKATCDRLTQDPLFTSFLLGSRTDFYHKIRLRLADRLDSLYAETYPSLDAVERRTAATFFTAGVFAVFAEWFSSDHKVPLETVCKQLSAMIASGVLPLSLPQS